MDRSSEAERRAQSLETREGFKGDSIPVVGPRGQQPGQQKVSAHSSLSLGSAVQRQSVSPVDMAPSERASPSISQRQAASKLTRKLPTSYCLASLHL